MRLIENTPERIVLRDRSVPVSLILLTALLGTVLAAVKPALAGRAFDGLPYALAIPVLLIFAHRLIHPSAVIGDARSGTVTISRGPLLRHQRIVFSLDEVAGAVCRRRRIDRYEAEVYESWMSLQAHRGDMEGEHRITGFAPFSYHCRAAGQLDAWIARAHENLH